ncbi:MULTISPECIES: hypothetical protein [unclassified Flavobacterium]|uniref:hypothetical protein n=1 Tax=unclassified Flavobacterium TaxID=196869 RepID=UPI001F13FA58|nr:MULTISPECIES: hypothetical protein [unclassified Flavobacterium]UMY65479.1 hypothetical protein MKO97_13355 [Flavobacterium sp. HJ-32-4]
MRLLLLLLTCVTASLYAQVRYEPGYFIDNNGKRTDCLVRDIGWFYSPKKMDYKLTETDESKTIGMEELRAFSVGVTKFERYTVDIDVSGSSAQTLSTEKQPKWEKQTVFLKVVIEGETTLYSYTTSSTQRFFYAKKGETPVQLVYKEYLKEDNSIGANNFFRQQLFLLAGSPASDKKTIEKLNYTEKSLSAFFLSLQPQAVTATATVDRRSAGKTNWQLRLKAGVSFAQLKGSDYNKTFSFSAAAVVPVVAFDAQYTLPLGRNKWSLFVSPNFERINQDNDYTHQAKTVRVNSHLNRLQLPLGMRHHFFFTQTDAVFIGGQLNFNIPFRSSLAVDAPGSVPDLNRSAIAVGKTISFGLGAGCTIRKWSFEARYETPNKISRLWEDWNIDYSGFRLLLGYRIF